MVKNFQARYPNRLKHIVTTPVEPIGVSMNTCITAAEGKYVTIWNVDDLRTSNSIQKQLQCCEEEKADLVHGNFIIVNKFGSTHGKFIDHSYTMHKLKELERSMVLGPFFMFNKNSSRTMRIF